MGSFPPAQPGRSPFLGESERQDVILAPPAEVLTSLENPCLQVTTGSNGNNSWQNPFVGAQGIKKSLDRIAHNVVLK